MRSSSRWDEVYAAYWRQLSDDDIASWDEIFTRKLHGGPRPGEIVAALDEISDQQTKTSERTGKEQYPPRMQAIIGCCIRRRKAHKGTANPQDVKAQIRQVCQSVRYGIQEALEGRDHLRAWNLICGDVIWTDRELRDGYTAGEPTDYTGLCMLQREPAKLTDMQLDQYRHEMEVFARGHGFDRHEVADICGIGVGVET